MKYQSTKLKNTTNFKGVKMGTKFVFSPSIIKYIIKQIKHQSRLNINLKISTH